MHCIDTPNRLGRVYEEYDSAALFDYDFNESQFQNYIRICKRFNRRFRRKNIYHAYSNANFDLWLILHKEDYYRPVTHNRAYIDDVKRIYGLGREDNIKNQDILETILKQITLDDVKNAIGRANKIKSRKMPEDGRSIEGDLIYENPDFSIHQFIETVLKDCSEL
ncbi:MAG TPA: RloB domain-containing protein [Clostridia bacterium]|nr:RloB domain-containing protein [Clostridia bacterium]